MHRRAFSGRVFSGLALSALFARPAKAKAGSIPVRPFGKTGAKFTVLGQGGAKLAYLRTKEAAAQHVRFALSLGVDYFDCARSYWDGHSEEVYGAVLPPVRKKIFLTTKSLKRTRAEADRELTESLRAMKTDHVDLWQIHNVQTRQDIDTIFGPGGAIEAFEAARKSGKCRFIGFSAHFDPEIAVAMMQAYPKFDTILMPLHAADPAYLSFEKQALPLAVQQGLTIQAMKVFGSAALLRQLHVSECIRYSLSLPAQAAVVGCSATGHWEDNARVMDSFRPWTPDEAAQVRERATAGPAALKGPSMEYWKRQTEK
ncbi:MAG: aldo/keto reductase [Acidobacteria bacterium]|nr:aldo/keto reductase [Acidobacteriota bacterium]